MPVESATYVSQLNSSYPGGAEAKSQGDDHLRLIKTVLLATFKNANVELDLEGVDLVSQITGNVSRVAADFMYFPATDYITATSTIALPSVATVGANKRRIFRSITTGDVQLDPDGADPIDGVSANLRIPAFTEVELLATASGWLALRLSQDFVSKLAPAGTVTPPSGWLLADGSAVSRTTYAGLFAVVGTAFNHGGEAGTDFRLPDSRSRTFIGAGTGTLVENTGAADVDTTAYTFLVGSNVDKWITGMEVAVTNSGGTLPTTNPANQFSSNVFVIRVDATHIAFATTRANAVAGTKIVISAIGSGTHITTHTLTARTLGQKLGEEIHANLEAESAVHNHTDSGHTHTIQMYVPGSGVSGGSTSAPRISDFGGTFDSSPSWRNVSNTTVTGSMRNASSNAVISTSGSSNAHNNMIPALVCGYMVKL